MKPARRGARALLVVVAAAAPALPMLASADAGSADCVPTTSYRVDGAAHEGRARICLGATGIPSGEPTVGITGKGTVVYYPANLAHPGTTYTRANLAISHDGGTTFTTSDISLGGAVPMHTVDLDPYMYVDPTTSRIFVESNVSGNCTLVSYSDDEGRTWSTHTVAGCVTFDHQNLFAGPPPKGGAKPTGYPNVVYRCAYNLGAFGVLHFAVTCEKSLDGGTVWLPTGDAPFLYDEDDLATFAGRPDMETGPYGCLNQLGHGVTGADGTVYLPGGMCGVPQIAISKDEGSTWTTVNPSSGMRSHQLPFGVSSNDTAVAVDGKGRLYALWVGRDELPYLATSVTGGRTWTPPRMVAPPGVVAAELPEIIADRAGRIAIAFMGSPNAPRPRPYVPCPSNPEACVTAQTDPDPDTSDALWYGYLVASGDALTARPTFVGGRVSAWPFLRGSCGPDTCGAEKDFIDVRFGPDGDAFASYVDACTVVCATAPDGVDDDENVGVVARLHL